MTQLTGPDYIIGVAYEMSEADKPFADELMMMVQDAVMGNDILLPEMTASRPLNEDEAVPVVTVFSAYEIAQQSGDSESALEVLRFGLPILAKWAEYLAVTERHPRLTIRDDID